MHLAPLFRVTLFEFCRDLRRQKTRVPGLSCVVVCVILRLAVSVEHRLVTDRQTHAMTAYIALAWRRAVNTKQIIFSEKILNKLLRLNMQKLIWTTVQYRYNNVRKCQLRTVWQLSHKNHDDSTFVIN